MNNRGPTYVKRKLSAKDWHFSYTQQVIMDERSSTQSFPNLHPHRHHPSYHPSLQSPEAGYLSSQSGLDPLEQYGSRGEESTVSFTPSYASVGRKGSNTSGSGVDRDGGLEGHVGGPSRSGSHFSDPWYSGSKKDDVWEDGESCESSADDFYSKSECYSNTGDLFYTMNCEEAVRCKLRANYNNNYTQVSCDAKNETVYSREANVSHFTKQSTSYSRSGGGFSDSSVDYRTDSKVHDSYLGRDEDYGSSCGSGEDQLPPADPEGPWLSVSPSISTGEGRWRAADTITLASGCIPQRSPVSISSKTYTQKLDSFSEAFLSQRKRRFPVLPSGDSSGQMWEFGIGRGESPGLVKSRHSCAFDSDSYLPPSSSSPAHPSLPSFPSPPTSSHLMSSVLSPPPTPLPPPSHSPSKTDSPGVFGGTGHSVSQGGESLATLQFFASRLQSLPSVHNSGMVWKIPMMSHCFPQSSGDPSSSEGNLTSSHSGDYGNVTVPHETLKSPELSFVASSTHHPSLHTPRPVCPSNTPSLHLLSRPSHLSGQCNKEAENSAPYLVTQKVKNGPANPNQSQLQQQSPSFYTGTPFPSILHSGRGHKRGHYTPRPLLNPVRRGTGLYSSISSLHHTEGETACEGEEEECHVLPCLNVGCEFQAELPPCFVDAKNSGVWSPDDEPAREQLLWKPWDELEERANVQDRVEKLLSMCSSSCLPGGGSNTELALHCLHYCQGNTMATLEMLLFSQPSPTGDYHYSGSDFWTDTERNFFSAALGTYGKDFSLIQKMVRTKTTCQCVEFYYLSKKILDKQKKLEEENRDGELEQQKSVTPICQPVERQFGLEEAVPVPPLASFFPCKLCGKMFYKIKSRNAHMKIHRQPQEDWTDRQLQHQLLTQRLALSHSTNLIPTPGSNLLSPQAPALTFPPSGVTGTLSNKSNADSDLNSVTNSNGTTPRNARVLDPSTAVTYSTIASSDSHVITHIDTGDSNQREPTTVLPFPQSWGSFGGSLDSAAFYCNTDGKEHVGAGSVGGKDAINWP